jgi:hypothetical protein
VTPPKKWRWRTYAWPASHGGANFRGRRASGAGSTRSDAGSASVLTKRRFRSPNRPAFYGFPASRERRPPGQWRAAVLRRRVRSMPHRQNCHEPSCHRSIQHCLQHRPSSRYSSRAYCFNGRQEGRHEQLPPDPSQATGSREHPRHSRSGGGVPEPRDALFDRQGFLGHGPPGPEGVFTPHGCRFRCFMWTRPGSSRK